MDSNARSTEHSMKKGSQVGEGTTRIPYFGCIAERYVEKFIDQGGARKRENQ